jgi:hypothetical protein
MGVVLTALGLMTGCRSSHNVGVDMLEGPPATQGTTEDQRRQIVARSQVWDSEQHDRLASLTPAQIKDGLQSDQSFTFNQAVTCRFVEPTLKNLVGGMTPKFLCGGGTTEQPCPDCNVRQKELKVKYGDTPKANPEIYAEVMGTRLMWLLGFKADNDYPVRVTCLNCPKDPWGVYKSFRDQTANLDKDKPADVERAKQIAASLGGSRSTRTYPNAVIEIKFAGSKIKVDGIACNGDREATDARCGGFSWNEAGQISEAAGGASRAQVDAFKLLAAFMTHGDNKPGNQRLVCPDDKKNADGTCAKPFAMIQDIGAGFGSKGGFFGLGYKKADIGAWSGQPLWDDRSQCRARLSSIHELKNPVVSDEGRAFLAKLMDPAVLTDDKVAAIFEASRIVEKGDSFNGHPATVADWVAAFDRKRTDMAQPCGPGHESVAPHPTTHATPPPDATGERRRPRASEGPDPEVEEAGTLPIREVSGLGLRTQRNKTQVLAIGDRDFEVAIGTLSNDAVRSFDIVDVKKVMRDGGAATQQQSQWESVKCDGSGRVFVLEETPGHVFIFNSDLTSLEAQVELKIEGTDPEIAALQTDWEAHPNSRGEGLALLESGHLLILKEKQSRRLIEFGPEGDEPVGFKPLAASDRFSMPDRPSSQMVPLRIWKFSEKSQLQFSDLSDLDVDHAGHLWVLTDEGTALGRIAEPDTTGRLDIDHVVSLAGTRGLKKPEGLIVLDDDVALVACDKPNRDQPLYAVSGIR